MEIRNAQDEEIEILAKNEEKLSELYQIYASKFPDYYDLWFGLAKEKEGHASWLRKLNNNSENAL